MWDLLEPALFVLVVHLWNHIFWKSSLYINRKHTCFVFQKEMLFSSSVVSDSLQPHGLQHPRLPCPLLSQTHARWVSDAIQPSHVLSSPSSPAFNLSQHQGLFQRVYSSHQMARASASVLPMNSGLISFRIDWFDLLAVQGTVKSLLQHHSSKASILQCLAFFIV